VKISLFLGLAANWRGVALKLHVLLILGFALSATGCEGVQAAPQQADEAQTTAPAAEPMAAEDPAAEEETFRNDAFLKHMHAHADYIDVVNIALADDDLDAVMTPAYWLSHHDTASGVPADWQPYLVGMREEARALESATDLETARAASKRITEQCQGCHAAAGIIGNGGEQASD